MNSLANKKTGLVVDIRDLVWNLLSQWKAMLIVALIMALITTSYKYMSDSKAYEEAMNSRNESEETKDVPADEQIETILSAFTGEDRNTIEYMVQQHEWVDKQKDYINNSILLNVDPTRQRTMILDYYIASEDNSDAVVTALLYGYSSCISGDRVIDGIGEVIGKDVERNYIAELISTPFNNNINYSSGLPIGIDDGDAVLEVRVVVPENVDSTKIEDVITSAVSDYSTELSKNEGAHSIKLVRSDEVYLYNSEAVSNRNNIIANIYNVQNNYIKNMEITLSDEQKAAVGSIMAIKRAGNYSADAKVIEEVPSDEPKAPGISKKYALAGFILGLAMYACIYALYVMFKGRITSAGQTEMYTGSRLIGEVYSEGKHQGIQKLLHSRIVNSIRYHGKLDTDSQIGKLVSALSALLKHAGTDNVTIFRMSDEACRTETADKVVDEIRKAGIDVTVKDANEDTDGSSLLDVKNAIIMAGGGSTAAAMTGLSGLLNEFDVPLLGIIFIQSV